jgi:hypothetical protein
VRLLVKQTQVKNEEENDGNCKNPEKNRFPFAQIFKEGEEKNVLHKEKVGVRAPFPKKVMEPPTISDFPVLWIPKLQIYFYRENYSPELSFR